MMLGRGIFYSTVLVMTYLCVLVYFDQRSGIFASAREIGIAAVPVCMLSLAAFAIRCMRWRWLLRRCGPGVDVALGVIAYFGGFSLTASPGKVGELIRIRYFRSLGVPAKNVVGCLIAERLSDVIALLLLATFTAGATGFWVACGFAVLTIAAVVAMLRMTIMWRLTAYWSRRTGWRLVARYTYIVGRGIAASASLVRPLPLSVSVGFGLVIYGVHAISFVYLGNALHLSLPAFKAVGVYPLATLIGAASFLPGGLGTTEVAIVLLLRELAVPLDIAIVASLTMRLASTWLAMVLGLIAATYFELRLMRLADGRIRAAAGARAPIAAHPKEP